MQEEMKMFNKPKKEKETYGIVGLGRFGYALAMELAEADADLLVLDKDCLLYTSDAADEL